MQQQLGLAGIGIAVQAQLELLIGGNIDARDAAQPIDRLKPQMGGFARAGALAFEFDNRGEREVFGDAIAGFKARIVVAALGGGEGIGCSTCSPCATLV